MATHTHNTTSTSDRAGNRSHGARDDSQVVFRIPDDSIDPVIFLWRRWLNARSTGNDEALADFDRTIRNATPTTFEGALCQVRIIQAREATGPVNSSGDLAKALGHLSRLGGGGAALFAFGRAEDCEAARAAAAYEHAKKAFNVRIGRDLEEGDPVYVAFNESHAALCGSRATSILGVRALFDELVEVAAVNASHDEFEGMEPHHHFAADLVANIRAALDAFAMAPAQESSTPVDTLPVSISERITALEAPLSDAVQSLDAFNKLVGDTFAGKPEAWLLHTLYQRLASASSIHLSLFNHAADIARHGKHHDNDAFHAACCLDDAMGALGLLQETRYADHAPLAYAINTAIDHADQLMKRVDGFGKANT